MAKNCPKCNWLMEVVMMGGTPPTTGDLILAGTPKSEFFMLIPEGDIYKAYAFWECENPACGYTEMIRDRTKDQPYKVNWEKVPIVKDDGVTVGRDISP